ncbi:MAG: cation diffusion facilitator family transporter [Ignavibacteriaceae bacterium]|jgi:cobalt-zinc-cadmium efflux system protein|nr:cation diffusion facilitator family transporter [Ignavibacteriaceae bacterium]MCW9095517.1 cation diffusion facilitator family transporter [Ignavibacteriaceae bacterium]
MHTHTQTNYNKAFLIGIILNLIYIVIEVIYGLLINSMALLADAGHNFSDVLGLLLAWGAAYLAKTAATEKRTYGFRKATILAALFNAILLMIAVGAISIEAIRKLILPEPVQGATMMVVAGIGVVINAVTAFLFMKGRNQDLNIKGAFLHMAADAGVSLGVVIAGLLILYTNWLWIDPVMSLVIVVVITIGTWGLLRDSFHLSMDAVPKGIDLKEVGNYLKSINGVTEVHDLHIWAMSTTEIALTAHLVIPDETKDDFFLNKICGELQKRFGIGHSTIQIEKSAQAANCEMNKV